MAWTYIGNRNKFIDYLCASTDEKGVGDIGSILYEWNTGKYYIYVDDTNEWQEYSLPIIFESTS